MHKCKWGHHSQACNQLWQLQQRKYLESRTWETYQKQITSLQRAWSLKVLICQKYNYEGEEPSNNGTIITIKSQMFMMEIRLIFGMMNGVGILLWSVDYQPFCLLARSPQAFIAENFHFEGGFIVWEFRFRWNLHDYEVTDLVRIISLQEKIYCSVGRREVRISKTNAKGQFLVKSFYNVLIGVDGRIADQKRFWDPSIPPRILVYRWVVSLHKILTMDQLKRRNYIIVNGCPLCFFFFYIYILEQLKLFYSTKR